MSLSYVPLKKRVLLLRSQGKTYSEIRAVLDHTVAKSTLSLWCREVALSPKQELRIERTAAVKAQAAREKAWANTRTKRLNYLEQLRQGNVALSHLLKKPPIAKIALAVLYAAEGAKKEGRGSLMFGNSDPALIQLFLKLLRTCYSLDISKFRLTVQCRADQDARALTQYWSRLTGIPLLYCYKPQIDRRTIGKPSRKSNYKGVCRIDYFSGNIYNELRIIIDILAGHKGR